MRPLFMRLPAQIAAALLLSATACSAQAAEFTVLIYESPVELAKRASSTDGPAYWVGYNQFAGALAQAGVLRGGSALNETETTTTRGQGGSTRAVPGARLGGYFVIDVPGIEAAKQWAQKAPAGAVAVEVVAHRPNPTMTAPQ